MVAEDQVFNFWSILSNELIGDVWLTIFILTAFIIFLTIRLKMPLELQILFTVLILAALFSKTLILIIWVFIVLIVGVLFYWMLSKAMR